MQILIPEFVDTGSVSASSEDTNFPVNNCVFGVEGSQQPKKLFKADSATTTITISSVYVKELALINCSCLNGTITVTDSSSETIFTETFQPYSAGTYEDYYLANVTTQENFLFMISNDLISGVTIEIELEGAAGFYPSLGLFILGIFRQFGRTLYGTKDNAEDSSIIHKDAAGGTVVIKRSISRSKVYEVLCTKSEWSSLYRFLQDNREKYLLFTADKNLDFQETYLRYGLVERIPQPVEEYNNIRVSLPVREVL